MFAHNALLPLSIAVVGTMAAPHIRATPSHWLPNPCSGLGAGGFDVVLNFTLAAYNSTLPNANTTGVPLVLGQDGAIDGAEFEVLSTWFTYPYNQWPNFSLLNGGLIANSNGTQNPTVSTGATNGTFPSFVTSLDVGSPSLVYCAVADIDPAGGGTGFPLLALNGQTDLFSLCKTGTYADAQNNIVYNATAQNFGAYEFDSCYPVKIQVVESSE